MKVTILNEKDSIETLKKTTGTVWNNHGELYVMVFGYGGRLILSNMSSTFGSRFFGQ